uniref:Right handed beta helix domain-containing protein n=1 Tax=uncultured organism TaxID=155900 RepID=E3T349_9ZZZZ|nr:hypothetical protein [uncultured organism]
MKKIILGFALCLLATLVHSKDLYVDASLGDDSLTRANNAAGTPWATIGRAVWGSTSRTNPNANEAAQAGDVVIVNAGTYNTTAGTGERYYPIWNPVNSGVEGSPIIIRAEGDVYLQSNTISGEPIIGTFNKSYIVWDGFILDESNITTTADTGPLVVWDSNNITIQKYDNLSIATPWNDNHNSIRIERSSNSMIYNNTISGNRNGGDNRNGSAVMLYYSDNIIIENNEIFDSSAGVFVKGANDGPVIIRNNYLHDLTHEGIALGGIGTDNAQNGAQIFQNIVHNVQSGITFIGYDSVSPANVNVYNNTFNNCSNGGIFLRPNTDGYLNINIFNNIISSSTRGIQGEDITDVSNISFSYNLYYDIITHARTTSTNRTFSYWTETLGKDTVGSTINVDPLFIDAANNNYKLVDGSAALTAGDSGQAGRCFILQVMK